MLSIRLSTITGKDSHMSTIQTVCFDCGIQALVRGSRVANTRSIEPKV
jgi:hypothetical protein